MYSVLFLSVLIGQYSFVILTSRAEFAQTMGLKPEQEFVDKIFPLVDRDNNGRVSFREFLRFMVLYSSGDCIARAFFLLLFLSFGLLPSHIPGLGNSYFWRKQSNERIGNAELTHKVALVGPYDLSLAS